jgi:hypothetical protein
MADLGDSSTANSSRVAGGPGHKTTSWIAVALIFVAAVILGFAFVLHSLVLAIVGVVVGVVGLVVGAMSGLMEDVH